MDGIWNKKKSKKAENKFRASSENQTPDPPSSSWSAFFRCIFAIRHFNIERSADYMHISNLALANSVQIIPECSLLRKNCIARHEGRINRDKTNFVLFWVASLKGLCHGRLVHFV